MATEIKIMPRLGMLQEWIAPVLAISVVAASIFTTVTAETRGPGSAQTFETLTQGETQSADLWQVAGPVTSAPVDPELLAESLELDPAWVETRVLRGDVDGQSGKVMVMRHFGLSEDKDVEHVVDEPGVHLEKLAIGFRPSGIQHSQWQWSWFSPDGKRLATQPSETRPALAAPTGLQVGQCSVPRAMDLPVSG